jgi:immune inhibitor A
MRAALALAAVAASLAAARPGLAVSVSPRVLEAARGTAEEAALRERVLRYERSKSQGVDRVYPQFALDLAKYPRGGVAHRNILVVLAEFPAEGSAPALRASKKSTPYYYHRLFFSDDPNDGFVSLREYYKINSSGRLIISGQVTSKWLTMPHSSLYYTNNASGLDFSAYPRSAQRLAEEAMGAAYGDFGGRMGYFDNDGPDGVPHSGDDDGYIDAVVVVHAGQPAEVLDPNFYDTDDILWSHEAGIATFSSCPQPSSPGCLPGLPLGEARGFLYLLVGEYNEFPADRSVGTYCHEFGHTLGLPDLYDPAAAGLGFYSLMALGNYLPFAPGQVLGQRPSNLDAWCRQYLGFDEPKIASAAGRYELPPVTRGGGSLRVWSDGEPGREYFLIENRTREGPDEFLPGEGVVIYHVNDDERDNLSGFPNYRVFLVQADSVTPGELESPGGDFGDDRDTFPGSLGKRSFTEGTSPSSRDFASNDTGIRVWNIAAGAADNADTASFDLAISKQPELRVAGVTMTDGGGDGYPDPGESLGLTVTMRNVGLSSNLVDYTLSTTDPYAAVAGSGMQPGTAIPTGGTGANVVPFIVNIGAPPLLPHDAVLRIDWTDGASSGFQTFAITVGMGAGLAEDFESGALGWTHAAIAPSGSDEWHASGSRAHGGLTSFKVGSALNLGTGSNEAQTYASLQDAALLSPAFDLAANSEMVFWSYIDAETNGGTGAWDGGRVEISMNGGEWIPVAVDGGYGYQIEFNSGAALRGADVFAGSPQAWRRVVADLSPHAGAARLRFRFASDEANDPRDLLGAQLRYFEGWYVDDVAVQGRTGGGPTPRRLSLRAGPNPYWVGGASAFINFRFSAADGLPHPGATTEVRVFDVNGRHVGSATAAANALVPSEFSARWDGRNPSGQRCRSGIYFAKVDFLGQTQTVRLVLLH